MGTFCMFYIPYKMTLTPTSPHFQEPQSAKRKSETRIHCSIQLTKSSCAINEGAIFLAVSWSKLLPISVLASCIVFFFAQLYFCFVVFWLLLLTVFAQIGKK